MMEKDKQIRAFIAIQLPDFVKTPLQDLQKKISTSGIKASFVNPKTLHLTLKFLGNIRPDALNAAENCMKKSVSGLLPYSLFCSGVGVFPSVKQPRVIWSGIRGETDVLQKLSAELDRVLYKDMGMKREDKRLTPHLTLARIKERIPPDITIRLIKDFENFHTPDFLISGISLFQSELTSSGAVHKELAFTTLQD